MIKSKSSSGDATRSPLQVQQDIAYALDQRDFDDIAKLTAQICGTSGSTITLINNNVPTCKAVFGVAAEKIEKDFSLSLLPLHEERVLVVPDTLANELIKNSQLVTAAPFIRFYAGVAVLSTNGEVLATISVLDSIPATLSEQQVFGIEMMAKQLQLLLSSTKRGENEKAETSAVFDQKFRLALEKIGDNVWEYDYRTGKSVFSKAENDLLGINLNETSDIDALWWKSIHQQDIAMLEENDRRCRLGEIDSHSLEYRLVQKDGTVKWVLDRGVVIEKSATGLPLKLLGTHTDITVVKNNEAALKESQQRLKFALEASGDGIWDWDMHTMKIFYSKRWKEMLGYSEEEIGEHVSEWQSLIHPDDLVNVQNELQIHFAGDMPFYQSEHRLLCKDGNYKWILDRGMVVARDESGKPLRLIGTHTDITQIKLTELALEQRLKQFKSLADNIPGVIYEYEFRADGTEGLRYMSPAIAKLFGITNDDFNNYYNYIHPDDVAMIAAKNKYSGETLEPFYCEARLVIPGKGITWHSITASFSYRTESGAKVFTGFMLDINERKNSEDILKIEEEKYRSIIANMNLGLLEVDINEKIMFANQSFCAMSGYEYDELVGKTAHDIFIIGENSEVMKDKNKARQQGASDAYEITVKDKRGQVRWWLISGAPRYDDAGKMVGSIGIHLDITDQKKLEIDLIQAREQAEESTRSKEVFLANMSHEIRTPMNAIVGMSNQLGKTNLDTTQQFYLSTINAASENLLFIINDILDISKIEAGKLQIEKIGFELKEVVSRAIRVLGHKAEEKGLTITTGSLDNAVSGVLMGDPFRLNQILLNLINNSIKFTEKGGVVISFAVTSETVLTQTVSLTVKDTGIGMEELFVKNLFEKFSQEDASVTRQYGGTGLGMSICRDLVELMGGEIVVESKKGIGTAISVVIEFEKGDSRNLPVKQTFAFDANMLENKKILVVDDNQMNRLVAATILKNSGAIISEAVNGQEALDVLADTEIDLVLLDIQMPVMDGMEAIGIIRKKISTTLPVIALTANAIKGDNDKCVEAGMSAYLSKPYKEKDLLNIVAYWLNESNEMKPVRSVEANEAENKLYDLSALEALSRGNESFVKKMVGMFVEQAPQMITEMEAMYLQGNYKAMGSIAHKLKPVIDNMGIASLKEPVREIEKIGKQEKYADSLPALVKLVKVIITRVADLFKAGFEEKEQVN